MTNRTIPATKAKTAFAELIDTARDEPVTITRNNHAVAVVMSPEEFKHLSALDDEYWVKEAKEAQKGGFMSPIESSKFVSDILNA